ncbi:MAG: AAA family ATPase [Alphaproteobacteria bacterium]|nr:AAA family ATPase [Alphaproteobacteria bacterium]
MIIVLMGVSGAGKTAIGTALSRLSTLPFVDADDHHPAANKAKMKAGVPLEDDDRRPWLETLNALLRGWQAEGAGGILACSALKESYRDILRTGLPENALRFVLLDAPRETIEQRLAQRRHEYMNPNLLDSQLKTLEPPRDALTVTNDRTPEDVAAGILEWLEDETA